jgi:hypothetical protein
MVHHLASPTDSTDSTELKFITHRIHGAAMYGNMDPINIPPMLAYIPAPWILWVIFFKGLFGLSAYHGLSTSIMVLPNSGDLDHRSDRSEVGGQVWAVPPREE